MKNTLKTNLISKLKLINVFLIIFGFNLIDIESKAHLRGNYLTESEAKEKAKKLGCNGTFKLKTIIKKKAFIKFNLEIRLVFK